MESEQEANEAVRLLNKKEIDGRAINVEVARPRAERPEGEAQEEGAPPRRAKRGAGSRRGRGRGGREGDAPRETGESGDAAADQPPREPRAPRERRRGRGGAAAAAAATGGTGAAASGEGATGESADAAGEGRRRGNRARRGGRANRRAEDDPREESDTTLFVANLPFSLTDEQLKTEFSSSGLPVKGAHVVVRVTGRSKGYGFVEYESKSEQTSALAAFEKKEIGGRPLIVKIALKDNRPATDAAGETPAPQQ